MRLFKANIAYSMSQYIDPFMEFIKTLCSETGLSIVLITHDNKFMKYGDRVYTADRGKFTLQENNKNEDL